MSLPFKPNFSTCQVSVYTVGFNIRQYTFFDQNYAAPLGVFWTTAFHGNGLTRTEIYDTWVIEQARRQGIARRILEEIKKDSDVISTVGVKSDMGEGFVKATGFVYDKGLAGWYLKCPRIVDATPVSLEMKEAAAPEVRPKAKRKKNK